MDDLTVEPLDEEPQRSTDEPVQPRPPSRFVRAIRLFLSLVVIAGVVFNGLTEDLDNWASYGYSEALTAAERFSVPARAEEELVLAAGG